MRNITQYLLSMGFVLVLSACPTSFDIQLENKAGFDILYCQKHCKDIKAGEKSKIPTPYASHKQVVFTIKANKRACEYKIVHPVNWEKMADKESTAQFVDIIINKDMIIMGSAEIFPLKPTNCIAFDEITTLGI